MNIDKRSIALKTFNLILHNPGSDVYYDYFLLYWHMLVKWDSDISKLLFGTLFVWIWNFLLIRAHELVKCVNFDSRLIQITILNRKGRTLNINRHFDFKSGWLYYMYHFVIRGGQSFHNHIIRTFLYYQDIDRIIWKLLILYHFGKAIMLRKR